jgi:asparagine synthase (glutamine-hydrolysing)
MRRLAIIDVVGGQQPMSNEDGTCWIVFNGEIYNHQEIRRELEDHGHVFRTRSDTEAILHGYEEWGAEVVRHLRGMFAFAVWDQRRERLFLARDPVGIKPLYWTRAGERFLFASEIKALLQDEAVPRRVNREGLHHYLTYLYVPAPGTMFEGIHELPPGHRLVWEKGSVSVEEYWAGPEALLEGDAGPSVTPDSLWQVLKESVNAHLLSDVPLGAFLSGGLDSSVIVALMAELSDQPVMTFSVGFRAAGLYDELQYARQVARHFHTDHNELVVDPDQVALLPEIVRFLDEPLADASVLPNFLVAQLARKFVKVALTGIGGDELFGGYRRYFGDAMARRWQRIPRPLRRNVLLPALRTVPSFGDTALGDTSRLVQKFLEPLDLPPEERYLAWNAFYSEEAKRELYATPQEHPFAPSPSLMSPHFARVAHRPFAERAMYVDMKSYLPGDPLFLSDRMTMANSVEARVPFVDTRVMDFAARIPLSQKLRGQSTKVILRDVLAGRVPGTIIRRPKRGFGTPIDLWLRRELSGLADRLLSEDLLRERGYFRPEYVTWMREQQASGRRDFSQHLWALLVFELWHRTFIDGNLSAREGLTFDDLGIGSGSPPIPTAAGHPGADRLDPRASQPAAAPIHAPARLRILLVSDVDPADPSSGAERLLNEHAVGLAASGHRVVVLTRQEHQERPGEEEYRGVRIVRHPVGGIGPLGFVRAVIRNGGLAFAKLLNQEPFDLVNVHQPLAAAAVLSRPESRSLPLLYTYLSPWANEYRLRRVRKNDPEGASGGILDRAWVYMNSKARERMEARAVHQADRLLVLSDFSTAQLSDIHGVSVDRVSMVPGGVDTDRFLPALDRDQVRDRLGLGRGPLLLTIRGLEPRMGLSSLVEAMGTILSAYPECRLLIGGTGPLEEGLRTQVRQAGLEGNVRLLGHVPEAELVAYYQAADLFVLPTRYLEGFGLVTVEAMACGTPVVGTPVGGTQEILRGYDPRFLTRSIEAPDLAARILERLPEVLGDEALRQRCRTFAVDHYSWAILIPQVEALMRKTIAQRRAGVGEGRTLS